MVMKTPVFLCVSLLVSTAPALAANGTTSQGVLMQAGPGNEYPDVMRLAPDLRVTIHACSRAWDWCDVEWRGNRGWIPAAALDDRKDDARVPVSDFGPRTGVPQVEFNLTTYWDTYYRQRPWYPQRAEWEARRPAQVLAKAQIN